MRRRRVAHGPSARSPGPKCMSPHAGWNAPISSITRSKGPRRARIAPYSVVRPVSPLKKTRCFSERSTSDDQSVALRVRTCARKNAAKARPSPARRTRHYVRLPPVELGDPLRPHAPRFEMSAHAERGHERHVASSPAPGWSDSRGDHSGRARRSPRPPAASRAARPEPAGTASGRQVRRRSTQPPHRIGQHPHAVDLDQHRRMAEPRRTQAALRACAATPRGDSRRATAPWAAPLAPAEEILDARHGRRPDRAGPAALDARCGTHRQPSAATPASVRAVRLSAWNRGTSSRGHSSPPHRRF